jgi:hypothetical protein
LSQLVQYLGLHSSGSSVTSVALCSVGARVGDFNGKNLGTVGSTQVLVDAVDVPGVKEMQQWYSNGGSTQMPQNLSRTGGKADRRVTTEILMDEVRSCVDKCQVLTVIHVLHSSAGQLLAPSLSVSSTAYQKLISSNNALLHVVVLFIQVQITVVRMQQTIGFIRP